MLENAAAGEQIHTNASAREIVRNPEAHRQFKEDAFVLTERSYEVAAFIAADAELETEKTQDEG